MSIRNLLVGASLVCLSAPVFADLEPFKDYSIGESITNVTTVKVDSNRIDTYLEGLSKTWIPANDVAKDLGQIKEYSIYVSQLPNSGDFNVILITEMASASDLQPNEGDYDKFMKKWGKANEEMSDQVVKTYPDVRTITGEYLVRKITIK